jgi:hypothetical protein
MVKQRGLAYACFTVQHKNSGTPGARRADKLIQGTTFMASADQFHGSPRAGRPPIIT